MEPKNHQSEVKQTQMSKLSQVTPLSKYLAMALFIILPFVGGYVGYTFAPEKVVDVERVVVREVEVNEGAGGASLVDSEGQYLITSEPTEALEQAIEILQRPAQTSVPDFNLDEDGLPRDMLYPGMGGDGIPSIRYEEFAKYNQPINCWVLYNGFVHSITPMFTLTEKLPAIELLTDKCGTDITDFLSSQPVEAGSLGTARFKYLLAEFQIPLGVEER